MDRSTERIGTFVRGFFAFLGTRGIRTVVLHGGESGFDHELSDVDFAVDHASFTILPALIREHCERSGWRLCQILRHETTAAYFVCSATDDPSCAVALDACSDYQRNGTVYLAVEELLANRRLMHWGGYEPDAGAMLRYRFAKAAAKNKSAREAVLEFGTYSPEDRAECSRWLDSAWGIRLTEWDGHSVAVAFSQMRGRSQRRPPLVAGGAWRRVLKRLLQPTGMVVVTGNESHAHRSALFAPVFGQLYFRRVVVASSFRLTMFRDLAASTLIILPSLGKFAAHFVPGSCKHTVDPGSEGHDALDGLAQTLAARCVDRERPNDRETSTQPT